MRETTFHMTPDEFRRQGAEVIEWIARYMETVEDQPVRSPLAPGDVRAALPASGDNRLSVNATRNAPLLAAMSTASTSHRS